MDYTVDSLTATLRAFAAYRHSVTEEQYLAHDGTQLGDLLDALADLEEQEAAGTGA